MTTGGAQQALIEVKRSVRKANFDLAQCCAWQPRLSRDRLSKPQVRGRYREHRISVMGTETAGLSRAIKALQVELDAEMAKSRVGLRFGLERGRAIFDAELVRLHKRARTSLYRYVINAHPLVVLTAPLIYTLIVPLVLLDVCVTLYQAICFPAYGLAKVRRADYLVFDRHHLPYLNALEKLNCAYCSYANGLVGYVGEIAARTEAYWCPIKHARRMVMTSRYADFADFGDGEAYRRAIAASASNDTAPTQVTRTYL